MVLSMIMLSSRYGLPFSTPSPNGAAFVGLHYLYPLLGVFVWFGFAALGQRQKIPFTFLVALPCYSLVLIVHFNLKLWAHHINSHSYDLVYWKFDTFFRPVIDFCFILRRSLDPIIPLGSNFYLIGFMAMFYISFCYHSVVTRDKFRELFLAALIFQGLGGLAYLIFPAFGPFIYEAGVEPLSTHAQQAMLQVHLQSMAGGAAWISAHGPTQFTLGLAAMPSLHSGGAFLFFLFAWRNGRVLVPLYSLILAFILINAVASRWHYLIDLPAGIALGWISLWLGQKFANQALDKAVPWTWGQFART